MVPHTEQVHCSHAVADHAVPNSDDSLCIINRPQVLNHNLAIRHDKNDGRILLDTVLVTNSVAASIGTDGRILYTVIGCPVLACRITVRCGDFHVENIVHVAAHGIVRFDNFRSGLLAWTTSGEEEVDEHSLATVEDVKQVHFRTMTIGSREIHGFRVGTLRFQAETEGQREHKGNKFFHR